MSNYRAHVLVCAGAGCISSGCQETAAELNEAIWELGLNEEVRTVETGCMGPCDLGPVVVVYPEGILYQRVGPEDARMIIEEHLLKGQIVKDLTYRLPGTDEFIPQQEDVPFFQNQVRIALRNSGIIDPDSIEEYIARDGYAALGKVLSSMTPEEVIETIKESGLRGRGGAGFPTGLKWGFTAQAEGDTKYVVCNADEGDPGAFMDRSILEGDPHSILEAMSIAGYAVGAEKGYVYVRAEYPLAVKRLNHAIEQARGYGLLGEDIFGTGFQFDIALRVGAGAFVCGEETALLASIEGRTGQPWPRPPFPANKGLWRKPTVLNNVETFANIAPIILRGAEWFSGIGTEESKGTKVFALAGDVVNTGLVEIPMGMPLSEIVFDIGGGVLDGKEFKAAQTGGPSGGCIPPQYLNTPVDYESLDELGTIMGSGGLVIVDEGTCMPDFAKFFLEFVQDESCGKCNPCRIGTKRMLEILQRITSGEGEEGDIERLEELGEHIKEMALCGLGQSAPNPVLTTVRYFREEYEAHVRKKKCPASVCSLLFTSPCQNACPSGVDVPLYIDLVRQGRHREAYLLIKEDMPLPGVCGYVCSHPCEPKCQRTQIDESVAIRALKRFATDAAMQCDGELPVLDRLELREGKVAVAGSGPAGLSAAHFLARLGYSVTVFEALQTVGGLLATGIPGYRLPDEVLSAEIETVRQMGVEFRTGVRVGSDITLDEMKEQGYEAIFMATGAPKSMRLGIPGEDLDGVVQGIHFLQDVNTGESPDLTDARVAVIGGGNSAVDAARTARRLGAQDVKIVYRRRQQDMPAIDEEIEDALEEDIEIITLATPMEAVGEDGRLNALECQEMSLGEYDRSGRPRPVPKEDSTFTLDLDYMILAIGERPEGEFSVTGERVETTDWGSFVVDDDTMATNIPGVFAGGDCVTGPDTVIEAIAAGKKAASAIDAYLGGDGQVVHMAPVERVIGHELLETETERIAMPRVAADRRSGFSVIELGYNPDEAVAEARRCLRCDVEDVAEADEAANN